MTTTIIKSVEDKRQYKYLTLENKIQVVLVSDSSAVQGACCAAVNIGSNEDCGIEGLAHFCEHMLFLGSKKYPSENEYSEFLSSNGGGSNAFTTDEMTVYYFDIVPKHLEKAVDIFAQFFIEPLFTESATERELNAIDNEHRRNLQNDYWRRDYIARYNSNKNHVYSHFATGSLQTLQKDTEAKGIDIRAKLMEFHELYYSANIITVAIVGKESLDELEKVAEVFKNVKNKNAKVPLHGMSIVLPEQLQKTIRIVPVRDVRSVTIEWVVPPVGKAYAKQVGNYLGNLIGHESEGSILSYLKKREWARELVAGMAHGGRDFSIMMCEVELTESGLQHWEEVVAVILSYIRMLQREGAKENFWHELQLLGDLEFRFKSKQNASRYAITIAQELHLVEPCDVLRAHYYHDKFDKQAIEDVQNLLTLERARVFLVSRDFESDADMQDPVYAAKYGVSDFSEAQRKMWNEDVNDADSLFFPVPNPFIPEKFDLVAEGEELPVLAVSDEKGNLWVKEDNMFRLPKSAVTVEVVSSIAYTSPRNALLLRITMRLLNDTLNEFSYPATLAGLSFSMSNTQKGCKLAVGGYNDKLPVLLYKIMETFKNLNFSDARFKEIKEKLKRELKNFEISSKPANLAVYESLKCLETPRWTNDQYLNVIDDFSPDDVHSLLTEFFSSGLRLEVFVCGNTSIAGAKVIWTDLLKLLEPRGMVSASQESFVRYVELPRGAAYYAQKEALNSEELNCAVENLYFAGVVDRVDASVIAHLTTLVSVLNEKFFHQARTIEQLGYHVQLSRKTDHGAQFLRILIQSGKHDPVYLNSRIEAFIDSIEKLIGDDMSDGEFTDHINSLVHHKERDDENLKEQNSRFAGEISLRTYRFNRLNEDAALLKLVTKESLLQFAREVVICKETRRKFSSQIFAPRFAGKRLSESKACAKVLSEAYKSSEFCIDWLSSRYCVSITSVKVFTVTKFQEYAANTQPLA